MTRTVICRQILVKFQYEIFSEFLEPLPSFMKLEVLKVLIFIFWVVMLCGKQARYQYFSVVLHQHIFFGPEFAGSMFLRKILELFHEYGQKDRETAKCVLQKC
jgi:hypothetical protein